VTSTSGCGLATDAAHAWLAGFLTAERVRGLLGPEAADLPVEVHRCRTCGRSTRSLRGLLATGCLVDPADPQAKGLGEYLRSRVVDVPAALLDR
jgi:hypothetical protein